MLAFECERHLSEVQTPDLRGVNGVAAIRLWWRA
jgi:hypothetical protein